MVSRHFCGCERRVCARLGCVSGGRAVLGRADTPERLLGRISWRRVGLLGGGWFAGWGGCLVFPPVVGCYLSARGWFGAGAGEGVGDAVFGVPGAQGLDVDGDAGEGHDDRDCCSSAVADVAAGHVGVVGFDEGVGGFDVDAPVVRFDPFCGAVKFGLDHAGERGHVNGDGLLGAAGAGGLGWCDGGSVGADLQLGAGVRVGR